MRVVLTTSWLRRKMVLALAAPATSFVLEAAPNRVAKAEFIPWNLSESFEGRVGWDRTRAW